LKKLDRVDLIDLDIEGQELASLTSVAAELDAKVKRLHIGTHSKEDRSRAAAVAVGSRVEMPRRLFSVLDIRDPLGPVSFVNGVQSWVTRDCERGAARTPSDHGRPPPDQRAGAVTRATSSMTICDATAPLAVLRTNTELAVSGSGTGR